MIKWIVLAVLVACALYVHFRGRERHKFLRQITDHSTFMAPINVLMYAFSRVPATPYLAIADFPELENLRSNWQTIRDEAVRSEEHTSELQSPVHLVCRLLLEKKKKY